MASTYQTLQKGQTKIAYHHHSGKSPGIVFLGGFRSDMTGTKATSLEEYAIEKGHEFTRFDYRGHGESSGKFTDCTMGDWIEDAIMVLDEICQGPQILVGSSMGGWVMLQAALQRPEKVAALVGLAAAPDFTEDLMWAKMTPEQQKTLLDKGVVTEETEYDDLPYTITKKLIEEARDHLLMRSPIRLNMPVRLLQGQQDPDVPWQLALKIADRLTCEDVRLHLIKDGDHRLSRPQDILFLRHVLNDLL